MSRLIERDAYAQADNWRCEIADRKTKMSALPPKADIPEKLIPLSASILVAHRREKAALRAAWHCGETTRLAVLRHPRILP
jgi:hypothetical protein